MSKQSLGMISDKVLVYRTLRFLHTFEYANVAGKLMESLSDTVWDVILSGTGLPQSLLAL